jgi:4-amino-4-deoxy-L-arabinose transferase-like glycosyltransferase
MRVCIRIEQEIVMHDALRELRFAARELRFTTASYALLAIGWFWLGIFLTFGFSRVAPVNSGASAGSMVCLWFAPLALLASIAGIFFERHKPPSLVAFVASLATSLLVLGLG